MELKDLAGKLIGFNTVSSESTVPMADFISEYLEGYGFVIERYPYEDKGVKKVNLIARKGGQESRLVFAGHMDTVPPGSLWDSKPFELKHGEGRNIYYGLGISDMKLFLAIAMKAGAAVSVSDLISPFALCFTSDEEVGCLGAKKLVDDVARKGRMIGKYVVIGEPTSFKPVYAHKGYIFLEVIVGAFKDSHGKDKVKDDRAHSSIPNSTTNVVEKALPVVIDELCKFKSHLEDVMDPRFSPAYPTMNIGGNIRIGREQKDVKTNPDKVAKNIIPRGFIIECDIRPLPGQDPADLIDIIKSNVEDRIRNIKTAVPDEKFYVHVGAKRAFTYPMETSKDSLIIKAVEEIAGHPAETVPFNTEGNIFNKAGSETVIWGPTDIQQAHGDNEYVHAELFKEETIEKYIRLIRRVCCERSD